MIQTVKNQGDRDSLNVWTLIANKGLASSPTNYTFYLKGNNTRFPSTSKRNTAPNVESDLRTPTMKGSNNETSFTDNIRLKKSKTLLNTSSMGKTGGFVMSIEDLPVTTKTTNGKKSFEVMMKKMKPMQDSFIKSNSSIVVEEKSRIRFERIEQQEYNTPLCEGRSKRENENLKYFLHKRNTIDYFDTLNSVSKTDESPKNANTTVQPTKSKQPKIVVRPIRESKIDKILREIQISTQSLEVSRGESPEKERYKALSIKNSFIAKPKLPLNKKSPRNQEVNAVVVENQQSNPQSVRPLKRFMSFKNVPDLQQMTFNKVRAPFSRKITCLSTTVADIKPAAVTPSFFRKMRADLSERKREIRLRLVKSINLVLRKLALLNMSIEEALKYKPFPLTPYEHPKSKMFLDAAKFGDLLQVERLLIYNKYIVYSFDQLKQTALHWAAKRGYTKLMKSLLERGADPDARDMSGRTPLFLAARGSFTKCIKLLLYFGASPMIKSNANNMAIDYATDYHSRSLLTRAFKLHVLLGTCSHKKFKKIWNERYKYEFEVKEEDLE